MSRLRGLYAITDPNLCRDNEELVLKVKQSLEGGTRIIQYRNKTATDNCRLQQALALSSLCLAHNAHLIINDDLDLAGELGLGLHLGREDGSVEQARQRLGPDAVIGATCHGSLDFALDAAKQGATYVAFGRFFPSVTKPDAPLATLDILIRAKSQVVIPIVAIGGINLDNAQRVIEAGADMVAVVDAIYGATDITNTCRRFNSVFT